jgi:hypothetical protein
MAAAAILKAVGHFRCCIFDFAGSQETSCQILSESNEYSLSYYSLNFFIMAAAAILDLMIDDL